MKNLFTSHYIDSIIIIHFDVPEDEVAITKIAKFTKTYVIMKNTIIQLGNKHFVELGKNIEIRVNQTI